MELINPFILYIGIPLVIILSIIKFKNKTTFKDGKKIANTKYVKSMPYYQKMLKKYKILSNSIKGINVLCIIISLFLLARPSIVDTSSSPIYNRDIFLCMDASGSMMEVNEKLVDNLKEMVKNLKGERFGITIFNTSSVVVVPLTDDYEYVLGKLDELQEIFHNCNRASTDYSAGIYYSKQLHAGTLLDNETRGSSLIGDGLASCVYNFNNLEEDRTRIIIFSTDNDLAGTPLVTLQEAAQISKENNVTVYGIVPDEIKINIYGATKKVGQAEKTELKNAIETTGGTLYEENSSTTVSSIVNNIEKQSKSLIEGNKEVKK